MAALRSAVAVFVACLALSATAPAHAQPTASEPSILMDPDLLMAGLARNHNDVHHRRVALQALMAEMLWQGSHDPPQDRAAAYAWMDLAAERGYPELLRQREA